MALEWRDRAALVGALLVAALCVRLGVWQLDRLGQRRARNAQVLARRTEPPVSVSGTISADSARDRRLSARGEYDYGHERLWRGRSYEGIPGVDLVTPLRLPDGSAVLVDRGWAPSPDGYHVDQAAYREGDSAAVSGIGVVAPRARGDVDPLALRDSSPYPLLPFVIQELPRSRTSPTSPTSTNLPQPPARWPAPEISDGPHLSYAIQWFSFAVIITIGSIVLAQKRGMGQKPTPGGTNNALS
ncbi:MAG TPA: SURF1 family protein [Gemmatimonadales bacterium]|nr:SURF1 family protein [Gemmatimonadales bacterium]